MDVSSLLFTYITSPGHLARIILDLPVIPSLNDNTLIKIIHSPIQSSTASTSSTHPTDSFAEYKNQNNKMTATDPLQEPWMITIHPLTTSIAILTLTIYLTLAQHLRYQRKTAIEAPFTTDKRPLSSMTIEEAHAIITQLQELEFPYAFAKARRMALLKVRTTIHSIDP